jgi:hypothetical protein
LLIHVVIVVVLVAVAILALWRGSALAFAGTLAVMVLELLTIRTILKSKRDPGRGLGSDS